MRATLASAIQSRLSDPRIEPLTSITRVEVSADLSVAHVYVSVLADETRRKLSVRALRHAAGRLRSLVAEQLTLRQVPVLEFRLDESVQRSFETVQQLDQIMAELDAAPDPAGEPGDSKPPAASASATDSKTCRDGGAATSMPDRRTPER